MNITFLGGGNMASALIGGLLNQGFPAGQLTVIEISADGRARLEEKFAVRCYDAAQADALACDVLLLAVKPQQMRAACAPLMGHLDQQLLISIAAGLRLADLSRWLGGYGKLIRVMPNTPALIGAGVTGLFALPGVSEDEKRQAEQVMQAVGSTVWVDDESRMDAVTAISGSGPAYVFLFIEALQQAAGELGFTPQAARQLALDTVLGSARLAAQSADPASVLRERVTSKGGTTEAALRVMDERALKDIVTAAAAAACARSTELGDLLGKD